MECHRCPHREDLESGKFRGAPFEQTPCASCELVEKSGFTIAFDDGRPGAVTGRRGESETGEKYVEDVRFPEEERAEEDRVPLSVMSEAVSELLALAPAVRDVVCWRFAGVKYADIARVQGVTVAAVENRQRRAMQRWPALRALFAEKAAKQGRRRRHQVSGGRCRVSGEKSAS